MIESLKDLEKLLKLLRKQGVTDFKNGGIELKLGDLPREHEAIETTEELTAEMLSDEELMMYSVAEASRQ